MLELLEAVATLPTDDVTLAPGRSRTTSTRQYAAACGRGSTHPDLVDRVVVHGVVTRDQVAGLYAGADVFVLTSYAETYGTVHGEALAAGLPTVGWRSGNLPNLIDGRTRRMSHRAWRRRRLWPVTLHRLATDDAWREELRSRPRQRGRTLPTWDQVGRARSSPRSARWLRAAVEPTHDRPPVLDVDP